MLRWCNSDSRRCSVFRVQRTACKNTNRPECIATRAHFLAWNIWGVKDPMTSVFRDICWSFYRDWWRCPQKGWGKKWIWRYRKKTKYSTSWKIGFRGWFSYFFPCKKWEKSTTTTTIIEKDSLMFRTMVMHFDGKDRRTCTTKANF